MKNYICTFMFCFLILLIISGCGSDSGTGLNPSIEQSNEKMGTVKFNIQWPRNSEIQAQVIPDSAVQLQFRVSAVDMKLMEDILNKPFTEKTINVPAGSNRLFDVIAVDDKGVQVAVGTALAYINPGAITFLTIPLTPVSTKISPTNFSEYDFSVQAAPNPTDISNIDLSISGIISNYTGNTLEGLTADNFLIFEDDKVRAPVDVKNISTTNSKIDIVFLLDTTSSMDEQIDGVKNSVQTFVDTLTSKGLDVRLAAVTFGDDVNTVDRPVFNFSSDVNAFKSFVGNLISDGGGDDPENDLDACNFAVKNFSYREGAQRIFILITDSTLHYSGDGTTFTDLTIPIMSSILGGNTVVHVVGLDASTLKSSSNNSNTIKGQSITAMSLANDPKGLADGTGGTWTLMPVDGKVDLTKLPIAAVILNGYIVTFPAGTIGSYHTVKTYLKYDGMFRGEETLSAKY